MNYAEIEALARVHGNALFLYDEDRLEANFDRLKSAFSSRYARSRIAYSYKTNYTPEVCRCVDRLGGYAEVVSDMEYWLAKKLGIADARIIYNGPYKSSETMRAAMLAGSIVNLDSTRDLAAACAVADAHPDLSLEVGIRCNFAEGANELSRFGFDVGGPAFREAIAAIRKRANLSLAGLQCHFADRGLASFASRTRELLNVSRGVFARAPRFLDIGGGFFGSMPAALSSRMNTPVPSFDDYAGAVCSHLAAAYGNLGEDAPLLFMEPGTALIADCFQFVTRVIDVKVVRGRRIATVAGSIFDISPTARCTRPPVRVLRAEPCPAPGGDGMTDIAGYTCVESDYLSRDVEEWVDVGNFVVYGNVGSYSIVMRPPFILPAAPILMIGHRLTGPVMVKRGETNAEVFEQFTALDQLHL